MLNEANNDNPLGFMNESGQIVLDLKKTQNSNVPLVSNEILNSMRTIEIFPPFTKKYYHTARDEQGHKSP